MNWATKRMADDQANVRRQKSRVLREMLRIQADRAAPPRENRRTSEEREPAGTSSELRHSVYR